MTQLIEKLSFTLRIKNQIKIKEKIVVPQPSKECGVVGLPSPYKGQSTAPYQVKSGRPSPHLPLETGGLS